MPAAMSPPPFGTAWHHRPIDDLKSDGQLEWSTVDEDAGKKKEREAKKCIFCDFNYKGGPKVIRVHLDCALKPRAIRACKPKEECVDRHAAVVKELRARAKKVKEDGDAANKRTALEEERKAEANGSSAGAAAAAKMFGKPTVDEVHEAWCKALVKKALPLDLVDDSEFREAIKATAKCGTTYIGGDGDIKLPYRKGMTSTVLPKVDGDLDKKTRATVLGIVEMTGCLLLSDGWTSTQNRPIINALAATPLGTFFLAALDTSGQTKDADYIAAFIITQIVAFGPDKVTAVCMDGACNSAFAIIEAKFPHISCFICPTHSLDNFMKNICSDQEQISVQVTRACSTIRIPRLSPLAARVTKSGESRPGNRRYV